MKRLRINHLILLVVLLAIVVVLTLPNRFVGVIAKTSSRWLRVEKPNEPTGIDDLTTSPALPDGSLDLTFDTDGRVLIDLGGPFSDSDEIYAVAVQADDQHRPRLVPDRHAVVRDQAVPAEVVPRPELDDVIALGHPEAAGQDDVVLVAGVAVQPRRASR